jgi:ribonuclease BN (tRNA processing enzyme)
VKLTVVGCSPAWPNPGGAQSGYLVESAAGKRLLLDCGPGVLPRLRLRGEWPDVDAIAITHFHLDHWGDLVPWAWGNIFGPGTGRERPELLMPAGGGQRLAEISAQIGGLPGMFEKAFRLREYTEGEPVEIAGFELRAVRVPHYGLEAYAFRVGDGERTLTYSGDSGPSDDLDAIATDADLFVCEATLLDSGEPDPRGHLSLAEVDASFAQSGARRLLVTHRPSDRPVGQGHELAHDGLEIVV